MPADECVVRASVLSSGRLPRCADGVRHACRPLFRIPSFRRIAARSRSLARYPVPPFARSLIVSSLAHWCAPQEIMFIETSAKDGFNIKLLFRRLATALPTLESGGGASTEQQSTVVHLTAGPPGGNSAAPGNGDAASSSYMSYCGC